MTGRPRPGEARRGAVPLRASRPSRRPAAVAAAVLAGLLAAAGCSGTGDDGRRHHLDGQGPLSATSGDGGNSITAPAEVPWYGSFGAFTLCSSDPGAEIELERVTYQAEIEPLDVQIRLRTVKADEIVMEGEEIVSEYLPFYTALGRPPHFDGTETEYAGTYSTKVAGRQITQPCTAGDYRGGYTDLIFVMKVGKDGGNSPRASIEYRADGKPYTLDLRWAVTACGKAISRLDDGEQLCPQ